MATSQNGYPVLFDNRTTGDLPRLRKWLLPDTDRHFYLRDGSTGFVLTYIASWWDDNIRTIDLGVWDDWGWAVRPVRGQTSGYSNHASGTAIDVDATRHPRGVPVNRNLTPAQVDKIHDLLAYLDRVVRWGGDYSSTVDAMHFELNKPLGDAERLALRLIESTGRGKAILAANPGAWAVVSSGTRYDGKPVPGTEPAPPPVVETEDAFYMAVLPGRWDAPLAAWLRRHKEAREHPSRYVGLTEGTNVGKVRELLDTLALDDWGGYHDPTPGANNIVHTWDTGRYQQAGAPWKVQLDTVPVWTKRGKRRPQTFAVGVALRDKRANRVVLFVGAHLELENTLRRRQKKEQAIATLQTAGFDGGLVQFPDAARVLWADFNRNAKRVSVRRWFERTWPGLTPAWVLGQDRHAIDWAAGGQRFELLSTQVLPRSPRDPLDHVTTVSRWGWDK